MLPGKTGETAWNKVCLGLVVTSSLFSCYWSLILTDDEVPGEGGMATEFFLEALFLQIRGAPRKLLPASAVYQVPEFEVQSGGL